MPEFDVVIVGSGASGLVAALTAASRGLKPLVLEKSDLVGGSTALSGGGLWVPANPLLRGTDNADDALRYLAATAGGDSSAMRQETFVRRGPDMVAFLRKEGLKLRWSKGYPDYHPNLPGASTRGRCVEARVIDGATLGEWMSKLRLRASALATPMYTTEIRLLGLAKRTLRGRLTELWVTRIRKIGRNPALTGGASLIGQLVSITAKRGAEIWLNSAVQELVTDNGKVTGVVVKKDGETQQIATKAVFLAAGGFAHNDALRQRHHPRPTGTRWTNASPTETGEVISLGIALGAATALMDEAWWTPAVGFPGGIAVGSLRERAFPGSIIVDDEGQRFMNEAMSYNECGHQIYRRGSVPAWMIIDDQHRSWYPFVTLKPGETPANNGILTKADTIAELADKIGLPAEKLEQTIQRFNGFAWSGKDEDFGRGDDVYDRYYSDPKVRPNPNLSALDTPPYYAATVFPGDLGTKGGLVTDEHARVLREDGSVIEGLYAVGNTTASVMGRSYPGPGCTIGAAMVFAYLGAQHLSSR